MASDDLSFLVEMRGSPQWRKIMIEITEETRQRTTWMHIHGESVDELLEYVIPKIKPDSRPYYQRAIKRDLLKEYTTLIDGHAIGCGTRLYLTPHTHEIYCELVPIDELREFEALYPA